MLDEIREKIENEIDSGAKAPQGVKGRLISPSGAPVAGATLYLIRGVGLDSFQMLLRWQKGERFPPVAMASSWLKKLPAVRTPWRIRISFAVQQMPERLMPLAPAFLAYSMISGSCEAATTIWLKVGS